MSISLTCMMSSNVLQKSCTAPTPVSLTFKKPKPRQGNHKFNWHWKEFAQEPWLCNIAMNWLKRHHYYLNRLVIWELKPGPVDLISGRKMILPLLVIIQHQQEVLQLLTIYHQQKIAFLKKFMKQKKEANIF